MTPKPDPMPLDPSDPQDARILDEKRQAGFDEAWQRVVAGSGVIVREAGSCRVHVRTRSGVDVVFTTADLPALNAAVALLAGWRDR